MKEMKAIEVANLSKSFGSKKALRDISFSVPKGSVFGFLGPNGAGKTTTIKILTGQLSPTYGNAKVLSTNPVKQWDAIASKVGVVPEQANLYERLTVYDNIKLYSSLYQIGQKSIDEVLNKVNLIKEKNIVVKKLSKGMKQRVLIARALVHKPDLLFLDEPTSGLDPAHASMIHRLLEELKNDGTTLFITTHNMQEADILCDTLAFLNEGEIGEMGHPKSLKRKYSTGKIAVKLMGSEHEVFVKNDDVGGRKIQKWMTEGQLQAIHSCEPTLSDIFMIVTGGELQ